MCLGVDECGEYVSGNCAGIGFMVLDCVSLRRSGFCGAVCFTVIVAYSNCPVP